MVRTPFPEGPAVVEWLPQFIERLAMKIHVVHAAVLSLALTICAHAASSQDAERPALVLDESAWVTFYDLPSRRFRNIRDGFLRRDFATVSRDIEATVGFLTVEAGRAVPELAGVFAENIDRLERVRTNLADSGVTIADLDNIFAQSHWVLSQHYLVEAIQSRDEGRHRMAGRNLIATAHHLERAVIWSGSRITGDVLESLESIREMASRLAEGGDTAEVYRDRPLRLAARTLASVGEKIDRRLRIDVALP
jgi:hypothetical protein